jgi:hypothetical protein
MNEIKLVTAPVIEYSILDQIAQEVKEELAKVDIKAIAPTEDSVSFLKKFRAEKRKQLEEFENTRKMIKKAVNEPYDLFNKAYEEKIAKQFKELDEYLGSAISSVENGLKEAKETELVAYFSQLLIEPINFLTFDRLGIKIGLSDSMKSLKTEVEKAVTKTLEDYNLIMTQPNAQRILVRYKQTLNVSQSITTVNDEIKQEHALNQATIEVAKPIVEEVVQTESKEQEIADLDRILTVNFRVTGTKSKLIALKQYIMNSGLELE